MKRFVEKFIFISKMVQLLDALHLSQEVAGPGN